MGARSKELLVGGNFDVTDPFFGQFPLFEFFDFEILVRVQSVGPHGSVIESDQNEGVLFIGHNASGLVLIFHVRNVHIRLSSVEQIVAQLFLTVSIPDSQGSI